MKKEYSIKLTKKELKIMDAGLSLLHKEFDNIRNLPIGEPLRESLIDFKLGVVELMNKLILSHKSEEKK